MSKVNNMDELFNGRHFDREVIDAAAMISGIELTHRIRKDQFDLTHLRLKETTAPAVWMAVFPAC